MRRLPERGVVNRSHDYQPPIEWTPYLDAKLTDARVTRRLGWKRVGKIMGLDSGTCERRGRALGIAAPLRRLGRITPAVKAEIMRRRRAGESYRAIGAALDIDHTSAFQCVRKFASSAARRAAPEVRQGPNAWAPGVEQGAVPSVSSPQVQLASSQSSSGGAVSFSAGDD